MDPARQQFIIDAKDIVDRLSADLRQLRARRAQGRERRELAARIFRQVHTLKGSAGSLGLQSISEVAHELEAVLDSVRLGRLKIDDRLLNLFEATTDAIADALVNSGNADESKTQSLITDLQAIVLAASPTRMIESNLRAALPEEVAHALSEYDLQHASEAVREGAKLFIVDAGFSIETFDRDFRAVTAVLREIGEVIATVPGAPPTDREINLRLLCAAEMISAEIRRRAEEIANFDCRQVQLNYRDLAAVNTPVVPAVVAKSSARATSVRVALKDLDELTAAVTDLLRDTTSALSALQDAGSSAIETANANLRPRFLQLEERLIKLRLVPLSDLLNGAAARAGRTAARQLKKDIEFEIIGGDVGIDKSLADLIAEPLMHLVRNAVSHGIETQVERSTAGKPPAGRVTLQGFSEGSRIYIVVTDDGRGIDVDRVARSAATQGIVNQPQELTADQALRLIFRPGFSTTAGASDLSGRGIGLEIVDQAMSQCGGDVRLISKPGEGASFAMIIPATLALMPCVVLVSDDQCYSLDAGVVADRLTLPESPAAEQQHFEWQGEELSLVRLNSLLAQNGAAQTNGPRELLVCKPSEHRQTLTAHQKPVAILIEAIAGQQELLVRSLGPHASLWHGISGAAEMMDGSVALMIDLARLIEAYAA